VTERRFEIRIPDTPPSSRVVHCTERAFRLRALENTRNLVAVVVVLGLQGIAMRITTRAKRATQLS
jgi:hypothetical protein